MRAADGDNVRVTLAGDSATVALRGALDMAATFTVEPVLERILERAGLAVLVVDLGELTFIDSTGLGVLLRVLDEARARAIELSIRPAPREVQRVFEVTGLVDSFPFAGGPPPPG